MELALYPPACALDDGTNKLFETVCASSLEGFSEDDDSYVICSVDIPEDIEAGTSLEACEPLMELYQRINAAYTWSICPCATQFIRAPTDRACLACILSSTKEDLALDHCSICTDTMMRRHAKRMSCCGQRLHLACHQKWLAALRRDTQCSPNVGATCPFCRQ